MSSALNPTPSSLGPFSPALGPWFSTDITLSPPNSDLSISISLNSDWLPPCKGLLSMYVASATRPDGLASFRKYDGTPAFTDKNIIAVFRLFAEVEERLYALMKSIPSVGGGSNSTVPTRARVRYLAIELPASQSSNLGSIIQPAISNNSDVATALGLKWNGSEFDNGDLPMCDMKTPGTSDVLLHFISSTPVTLWAFDAAGHSIDPGAVANWWSYLANTSFNNLWVNNSQKRTATTDPQLTVHLVNAHEGNVSDDLLNRLNITNVNSGTGPIRSVGSGSGGVAMSFTAAPVSGADNAPVPKVAILPDGKYSDSISLWQTSINGLTRDYVRIGVVDVEGHLVGQSRVSPTGTTSNDPSKRRADDQNRSSTRVTVARTSTPTLMTTSDTATNVSISVLSAGGKVNVVSSVLERDWGSLVLDPSTLPAIDPPIDHLPAITVSALGGDGSKNSGGTIAGQKVLLEIQFDSSFAGAWVRSWPQGFDSKKGVHYELDGGAGKIRSDGNLSIVMAIPDGAISTTAQMGVDIVVVTRNGSRFYMDNRFSPRPPQIGGVPISISAVTSEIVVCETGQTYSGSSLPNGTITSGSTLFSRETPHPMLIDRTSLPDVVFSDATFIHNAPSGAIVQLTQPAFKNTPDGNSTSILGGVPNTKGMMINRLQRTGLTALVGAGTPLPTMERLEVVTSQVSTNSSMAAVASTPALGRYHEMLPHQLGHPGSPGAVDVHGTVVALNGSAAVQVAEYTRDRTAGSTISLIQTAIQNPLPSINSPSSPSAWATVLRTVAAEVEMESGIAQLVVNNIYNFDLTSLSDYLSQLSNIPGIPSGLNSTAQDVIRALNRRVLVAAYGAREGATSLLAAINRAEDFIYIETPELDDTSFGASASVLQTATDDVISIWTALKQRMISRPGLRVLICIPVNPMPGFPDQLARVRTAIILDAIKNLKASVPSAYNRIAIFSPSAGPARTLRLSSTTVIVDDAYALTGTTHLWRRGLSFDSSLAVAVFDEQLDGGRPAEVKKFRRQLIADHLGLTPSLIPDDPAELVNAVGMLSARGGGSRLAFDSLVAPDPQPSSIDKDLWNRDGSLQSGFDPLSWLTATVHSQLQNDVNDNPTP